MVLLLVVREGYGLGRFAWSASGLGAYHKFQPEVFVKRVVGQTLTEIRPGGSNRLELVGAKAISPNPQKSHAQTGNAPIAVDCS